jgi:hypothetical protein
VQKLLADEVVLLAGEGRQRRDLLRHALLLGECEGDRLARVREGRLRRLDRGDDNLEVGVEQVLDDHHRVVPLLERLAVEVGREQRQRLLVEPDRDRDVLLGGGELVRDLLVELLGKARHECDSTLALSDE